ncbi:hypothetical protein [Flavobacterium undicola]|uniref:hypothetical protein n=1 Tax=Flavobacterium undicola TaxID=1932779 RepID=UPI001377ECBD|nr:hypothetical protein [Flavobacterium undicola]MBA0882776.1 hypothetical protein [Flavobacterium undicola]
MLSYKTVFGHYRNWRRQGSWKDCWIKLLKKYKSLIDLSSADLDGSHTTVLRGDEEVGYQGRKKTTNTLYITDSQVITLAIPTPISGNHNDLYNIEVQFEDITATLESADISVKGLFINADAGFDSDNLLLACQQKEIIANMAYNKRNSSQNSDRLLDEELYKEHILSKELMHGWTAIAKSLIGSTLPLQVG